MFLVNPYAAMFEIKLKRDREGLCVSRGSGPDREDAMHCESVSVQILLQVASGYPDKL